MLALAAYQYEDRRRVSTVRPSNWRYKHVDPVLGASMTWASLRQGGLFNHSILIRFVQGYVWIQFKRLAWSHLAGFIRRVTVPCRRMLSCLHIR